MSAAILSEAESMERQAREMLATLHRCTTWDERIRCEDRIEELREAAGSIKARIESSREHIQNYYGLTLHIGLEVKHASRPGRIVGFSGQYVEVQLDGDDYATTCHATSEMEYPRRVRTGPGPDERFAHLVQVHPA